MRDYRLFYLGACFYIEGNAKSSSYILVHVLIKKGILGSLAYIKGMCSRC